MSKVKLNVVGISISQNPSGNYALILGEEEGSRRIPIIIGSAEAQDIALMLENIKPPRPLLPDVICQLIKYYDITIEEVFIYQLREGIFYTRIVLKQNDQNSFIELRVSDAASIALRIDAPIYTTSAVLEKAGIKYEEAVPSSASPPKNARRGSKTSTKTSPLAVEICDLDDKALQEALSLAVEQEYYELASLIRDEIEKRKQK